MLALQHIRPHLFPGFSDSCWAGEKYILAQIQQVAQSLAANIPDECLSDASLLFPKMLPATIVNVQT